jgi:hypothetical protein
MPVEIRFEMLVRGELVNSDAIKENLGALKGGSGLPCRGWE